MGFAGIFMTPAHQMLVILTFEDLCGLLLLLVDYLLAEFDVLLVLTDVANAPLDSGVHAPQFALDPLSTLLLELLPHGFDQLGLIGRRIRQIFQKVAKIFGLCARIHAFSFGE